MRLSSMSIIEDLLSTGGEYTNAVKPRMKHPTGWEPGINTEAGRICVQSDDAPDTVAIDWTEWLEAFGFSAETFTVLDDTVEVRSWDSNMGGGNVTRFYYYKAKIVRKRTNDFDYDDLLKYIRGFSPLKAAKKTGTKTYIISMSDLQIGKKDGDGLKGVVDRMLQAEYDIIQDIRKARKSGEDIGQIVLAGLGDIIEGCDGHYKMQTFQVELDRREQVKVARRLLLRLIRLLADETDKLLILSVPGNHGENRKGGKAFTNFGDNDDVAVFEQLSEILAENPDRFGHVKFLTPYNDLSVTIDIDGTVVGFIHGHQARSTARDGLSHTKIWGWWKNQAHAGTPVGSCDILVSGHFHYYTCTQNGSRTHFQSPPLDSESQWYSDSQGYGTKPGILTFLVDGNGWSRATIL